MAAPVIGRRRRWCPPRPTVDWSHPLASGLVRCWVVRSGASWVDIAGTAQVTDVTSTEGMGGTGFGRGLASTGSAYAVSSVLGGLPAVSEPITVAVAGAYASTANQTFFAQWTGTFYGWLLYTPASGQVRFIRYKAAGQFYRATTSLTAGTQVISGSANDDVSRMTVAANGAAVTTVELHGTSTSLGVPNVAIHARSDATQKATATSAMACMWNREFSVAEHLALNADPFCFLRS